MQDLSSYGATVALFGFGKDRKEGGSSELVLAYLEDAQRVRTPFLLKDKRKVEVPGHDPGAGRGRGLR